MNRKQCVTGAIMASAAGLCAAADAQTAVPVENHSFSAQVLDDGAYVVGELTDWTILSGMGGVFNPTITYFPDEAPHGANTGFIRDGVLSQDVGPAVGLATYILEVDAGLRTDLANPDFSIQLLLDGAVISSFTGGSGSLAPGSFGTFSTQYTTQSFESGGSLSIRLISNNTTQINYDNVQLSYSLIPSPGTLALLGMAGLGLRRRRRRA